MPQVFKRGCVRGLPAAAKSKGSRLIARMAAESITQSDGIQIKPSEPPRPPASTGGLSLGRGAASLDEEIANRSSTVFLSVLDVFKVTRRMHATSPPPP